MPDPAIQSINQHTQKTTLDWLFNILVQPSTGAGSGVAPATHEQYGLSLDLLRQALVEVGNVVNVLTTTVPGKVLDARQGKVLADSIAAILAQKAAANGIATLGADGKIPSAQIPSIALVDVFPVASEAAMLASGAEQGDMAIRSDTSQVFILSASPATTIENWIELSALKALVDAAIADIAGAGRTTETVKGNADAIAQIQDNKVTAFQETPDDTHYPSEKLVYDFLEAIKGTGYTEGSLKTHEDRLDTLEGTGEGSVAKAIDDALEQIETDKTLTVSGAGADAKVTGDKVGELKSVFEENTGIYLLAFNSGHYYETSGAVGTTQNLTLKNSVNYKCVLVECSPGDVFVITGTGGSGAKLWAFLDSENRLLGSSSSNATLMKGYVVAPANTAKAIINVNIDQTAHSYYLKSTDDFTVNKVNKIGDFTKSVNPTVYTSYLVNDKDKKVSNNDYVCTDYIFVDGYFDAVKMTFTVNGSGVPLHFYDVNKKVLLMINSINCASYGITSETPPQTVTITLPTGTKYIRANMRSTYYPSTSFDVQFINNKTITAGLNDNTVAIVENNKAQNDKHLEDIRSRFDGSFNYIAYSNISGSGHSINTREHFLWCAEKDVFKTLKADMQLTSDGKIILCHDSGFTLNGSGDVTTFDENNNTPIHSLTYAECIALKHAGTGEYVCGIDAVLRVCKTHGKNLYITLRDDYVDDTLAALFPKLIQYSFIENTIINCYPASESKVQKIRAYSEDISICWTANANASIFASDVETAKFYGNVIICPFAFNSSSQTPASRLESIKDTINYAKSLGMRCYVAILYDNNDTDGLLDYGVVGAQTYVVPVIE